MNDSRKQRILEKLAIPGTVGTVAVGGKRLLPKEVLELVKDNPGMTILEAVRKLGGKGGIFGKIGPGMTPVPK